MQKVLYFVRVLAYNNHVSQTNQMKISTLYTYVSEAADRAGRNPHHFSSSIEHNIDASDEDILEMIFAACNRGSGRENAKFMKSTVPSLSVGDRVALRVLPTSIYLCAPCGWTLMAEDDK
jgi:hypothetical protein